MILDVDEARRHHVAPRVDALPSVHGSQRAARRHRDDPVATNADVAVRPRVARPVHEAAVLDHDVVGAAVGSG